MRLVKKNTHIDFMGKRKMALGLSALFVIVALVALPTMGLNFGLDFTGGTEVEVRFNEAPNVAEVRESLADAGMADATVQRFGSATDMLVRIPPFEGETQSDAAERRPRSSRHWVMILHRAWKCAVPALLAPRWVKS